LKLSFYNIGHKTQNKDKQNKNRMQETKNVNNTNPIIKPRVHPCARVGLAVPASFKTPVV